MKARTGLVIGVVAALAMGGVSFAKPWRGGHPTPPPPIFSAADFDGTYVAAFRGSVTSGGDTGVLVGNGLLTATPTSATGGTVAGTETVNDGSLGDVCTGAVSGTFTVASNGTGTLTTTFTPSGTINVGTCSTSSNNESLVITSDREVSIVQTDQFLSTLGSLTLQGSPVF